VLHPVFTKEGFGGHLSSDPFLFWFLVVGMNAPWAFLPPLFAFQSWKALLVSAGGEEGGEEEERGGKKGGKKGGRASAKSEPAAPATPATPVSASIAEGRPRRRRA